MSCLAISMLQVFVPIPLLWFPKAKKLDWFFPFVTLFPPRGKCVVFFFGMSDGLLLPILLGAIVLCCCYLPFQPRVIRSVTSFLDKGLKPWPPIPLPVFSHIVALMHSPLVVQSYCSMSLPSTMILSTLPAARSQEGYKDATLIMQLLRDNLTLWTSEGDN